MNPRSTWFWILIATTLLGAIILTRRISGPIPEGPTRIFGQLDPAAVTSLLIRPAGQLEIRADLTNGNWRLVSPLAYPAQELRITNLLHSLAELIPATRISVSELRAHPHAKQDFGFDPPQTTLVLLAGTTRTDIQVGALTAPGDQVFIQRVGDENVYVVGADLLQKIPRSTVDWRNTAFVQLDRQNVNRLTITNQGKAFTLQRGSNAAPWRLTTPIPARANHEKIQKALEDLMALRVNEFIQDDPEEDLERFGLQPARLTVGLWQDTNLVAELHFGGSPSNQTDRVYARNPSLDCVVTVSLGQLAVWGDTLNEYRDPFLIGALPSPQIIEVRAQNAFTLQRRGERDWQIMPDAFPVDSGLVNQFLAGLAGMRIVSYVKDVVTPPDLPAFGLDAPLREYFLRSDAGTNAPFLQVTFGTNQQDSVFATRSDENSVYTVALPEVVRLPSASWMLRERKIWEGSVEDVTRVLAHDGGSVRQINRNGPHDWTLAGGSQGIINELAVEETVRAICQLSAGAWSGRGEALRGQLGFTRNPRKVVVERKTGSPLVLEFGGEAPSTFPYAGVTLDKQFWVFEISWPLYRDIISYLGFNQGKP